MSRRNLILVGLLLGNPRIRDGFTSGKVCAELAQEKVSDLTVDLGYSWGVTTERKNSDAANI